MVSVISAMAGGYLPSSDLAAGMEVCIMLLERISYLQFFSSLQQQKYS